MTITCNYCGACHPCPAGLDIPLINQYYDRARAGDGKAAEDYRRLDKTAGDCIRCRHCNRKCPKKVAQMGRMRQIKDYFGK